MTIMKAWHEAASGKRMPAYQVMLAWNFAECSQGGATSGKFAAVVNQHCEDDGFSEVVASVAG